MLTFPSPHGTGGPGFGSFSTLISPRLPTLLEVLGVTVPLVVAHPEAPAADLPLARHPEGPPGAHPLPLDDLLRQAGSRATEGVLLVIVSD